MGRKPISDPRFTFHLCLIYAMWESTSSSSTQHLPSGCKETILKKQCSISSASSFFHSCSQLHLPYLQLHLPCLQLWKRRKAETFSCISASVTVAKDGDQS